MKDAASLHFHVESICYNFAHELTANPIDRLHAGWLKDLSIQADTLEDGVLPLVHITYSSPLGQHVNTGRLFYEFFHHVS